jgi:ribosomal protein S18 acetylase RimI-like enzyme
MANVPKSEMATARQSELLRRRPRVTQELTIHKPVPLATEPLAPSRVQVRRADVQDAGTVRTLVLELAAHENSVQAVEATTDDWRRMLADPAVLVLLAFVFDTAVGYVSGIRQLNLWSGRDIFAMDDLYVRAEGRDRGIGGQLMAGLAEEVIHDQLVIAWGVLEDNEAGHRFYRRLGASLRTTVVASWSPNRYSQYLDTRA